MAQNFTRRFHRHSNQCATIISLLRQHPVSRKENLQTISKALGNENNDKNSIALVQSEIDEFLRNEPSKESKVHDIASEIIDKWKNKFGHAKPQMRPLPSLNPPRPLTPLVTSPRPIITPSTLPLPSPTS